MCCPICQPLLVGSADMIWWHVHEWEICISGRIGVGTRNMPNTGYRLL
jgi:hypothetical protein